MIKVYIEKVRPDAKIPTYANNFDAGMDICACEDRDIDINSTCVVPTGLKVAIPEGYEIQVRPRSGLSLNTRLRITNSPGTIDTGYRGEIGIIIHNSSQANEGDLYITEKSNGQGIYHIKKGDRIAQIVLQQVPRMEFVETDDVTKIGQDRGGGFGSTGVR